MPFIEVISIITINNANKPRQAIPAFSLSLEAFSFGVLVFCSFIRDNFSCNFVKINEKPS